MIEPDAVCHAARRISDFAEIHGADCPLTELFAAVGIDEPTLAHMIRHTLELGIDIEPRTFIWGVLMGLLSADRTEITLTDHDISELLRDPT